MRLHTLREDTNMLGTFEYHNPTKLYFGPQSQDGLNQELP